MAVEVAGHDDGNGVGLENHGADCGEDCADFIVARALVFPAQDRVFGL